MMAEMPLIAAPEVDLRQAVKTGLLGGIAAVFLAAGGILETFSDRSIVEPILSMGYLLLLAVPFGIGYLAGRPPKAIEGQAEAEMGGLNVVAGLLAGFVSSLVVVIFLLLAGAFDQNSLRNIFINISPRMYELLKFDQQTGVGLLILVASFSLLGTAGGALDLAPRRWFRPVKLTLIWLTGIGTLTDIVSQILRQIGLRPVTRILFDSRGGLSLIGALLIGGVVFAYSYLSTDRPSFIRRRLDQVSEVQRKEVTIGAYLLLALFVLLLPRLVGSFLSEVMDLVGIFAIMALGLNIVLGYAGLLDLGYVAFFAVGAYTTAVFTSGAAPRCVAVPAGFCPQVSFWAALPFAIVAAIIAGIVVGTPVIRMRGDYLAIVTLGFGEIARLIIQSDWFKPVLGAAQGILNIPDIRLGPVELNTPAGFFYPILGFVALSTYALWRLSESRMGRAWMALREDEPVAEVMGVNIVSTKLLAFITGAILASFSGALFASKIGSVFPHSFVIEKSIQVLIIVIVGGVGSIPGMIAGAFLIIGVPELLREFDEYRFLAYGVLLVVMMLYRPEGLIPNRRISRLLTEEEASQDAWAGAKLPESVAEAETA